MGLMAEEEGSGCQLPWRKWTGILAGDGEADSRIYVHWMQGLDSWRARSLKSVTLNRN